MKLYRAFRPTPCDPAGLALDDRQDWLVAPVIRTRDSSVLQESNFASALKALGGESDNVEVHRFGHWGPGWFEIIIVRPGSPAERIADDIERALADYPVLDDMDFSDREYMAAVECWTMMPIRHRVGLCQHTGDSIFAARRDTPPDRCYEYLCGTV